MIIIQVTTDSNHELMIFCVLLVNNCVLVSILKYVLRAVFNLFGCKSNIIILNLSPIVRYLTIPDMFGDFNVHLDLPSLNAKSFMYVLQTHALHQQFHVLLMFMVIGSTYLLIHLLALTSRQVGSRHRQKLSHFN